MLDRGGVRVFYEVCGSPGGRTPVLLTHGYASSAQMWEPNLEALTAGRQVIVWDIRGHGRTDSPDDPSLYTEDLSVEDMAAVLDAAGAERAVVGGLSLGGYLSLAFNLRHPERVAALMLFDTGPGYRRDEAREDWNRRVERRAAAFDARGLDALGGGPEVRHARHRSPAGLARAARGIMAQHDARIFGSLPSIAVPTLVVVGSEDTAFLAAADVMVAKIPGATKAVIEGAGHASNVDQPEAFNRAVNEFLEAVCPPEGP
jgi:pimeloyl-ACP methyl ester carboxylesterase